MLSPALAPLKKRVRSTSPLRDQQLAHEIYADIAPCVYDYLSFCYRSALPPRTDLPRRIVLMLTELGRAVLLSLGLLGTLSDQCAVPRLTSSLHISLLSSHFSSAVGGVDCLSSLAREVI